MVLPAADNRPAVFRVALVGAGHVATAHLEVLRRLRGVEVVALCDASLERARALARRYRVPRVYGSYIAAKIG